jgi:hypothetical protein
VSLTPSLYGFRETFSIITATLALDASVPLYALWALVVA